MTTGQLLSTLHQVPYFTKQNLGVALGKEGEDLNYWIKKLTRERLLLPLRKGFYLSKPNQDSFIRDPEQSELYWLYIANTLRSPSYVSLEYVLSKYNIIPESTFALTSVTRKSSRVYKTDDVTFVYRSLKEDFFNDYDGYQLLVFGNTGLTVRIAYPFKALFDFLYFKKFSGAREMREFLLETGRINWSAFPSSQKIKFQQSLVSSKSPKLKQVADIMEKENVL